MGMPKLLNSPEEHADALAQLTSLLEREEPRPQSVIDRVELLILLIEDYERRTLEPLNLPSPVEAILFRLEQQGLTQRDLIPYVGSASRVSEILSGKRGLSISMIRALHDGLGIPADVLIREPQLRSSSRRTRKSDLAELMRRRGWIGSSRADVVAAYLQPVERLRRAAAFKRTLKNRSVDEDAVVAWTARIYHAAQKLSQVIPVVTVNYDALLSEVIKLSWSDEGPRLAVEFLRHHGLPVIIEPGLPKTHVDGVAIVESGFVAIGMTSRFDRLDSFWFTLAHELSHLIASQGHPYKVFVDDLEAPPSTEDEIVADTTARERLIPSDAWQRSAASRLRSPQAVEHLARELRIHPAIVAGRVRFEYGSYRVLGSMIGVGKVRRLFPEINWDD